MEEQPWLFPFLSSASERSGTGAGLMFARQRVSQGLGQLEAYIDAEEGVAFQMDNDLFWDSMASAYRWAIEGLPEKKESSKFWITRLYSGKALLRNWRGMYLAQVEVETNPRTFPIQLVLYSNNPSLQFDVYHRGNRVAFRASNGLFLARTFRGFHTIEAAKYFADDSCCFLPLIGDLVPPTFEILRVFSSDLLQVSCSRQILKKQTYINRSAVPVQHTFTMAWETQCIDQIFWYRLWGLGLPCSCSFMVGDATPTVTYTRDNEHIVSVNRQISESRTEEVQVPPRTRAVAELYIIKHHPAPVPFKAVVQKVKLNGDPMRLTEDGIWKGLAYHGLQIQVRLKGLDEPCKAM